MESPLAVAGTVVLFGWLIFAAMMVWSRLLIYKIHTRWQLIGPETEQELRRQGMPRFEGVVEESWIFHPFMPQIRVAHELSTKSVTTDDGLATVIRRYRRARQVAWATWVCSFVFAALLIEFAH